MEPLDTFRARTPSNSSLGGRKLLVYCSDCYVVSAGLEDSRQRDLATTVGTDLKDYISQIDYQKYYDAMGAPGARGGQREAEFAEFSLQVIRLQWFRGFTARIYCT